MSWQPSRTTVRRSAIHFLFSFFFLSFFSESIQLWPDSKHADWWYGINAFHARPQRSISATWTAIVSSSSAVWNRTPGTLPGKARAGGGGAAKGAWHAISLWVRRTISGQHPWSLQHWLQQNLAWYWSKSKEELLTRVLMNELDF